MQIIPVIMAGGSGTRLWPLSRKAFPKQFLPLTGNHSLFQNALLRTRDKGFEHPWVICSMTYADIVKDQAEAVGVPLGKVIYEPVARNTAPAIGAAAIMAQQEFDNPALFMMASDHVIDDGQDYMLSIAQAMEAAAQGHHVAFGLKPLRPETGYGYVKAGDALTEGSYLVDRFAEKPDLETAKSYVDSGDYSWNSGMFLFPVKTLISDITAHSEALHDTLVKAVSEGAATGNEFILNAEAFGAAEDISVDYAVMEKSSKRAMVVATFAWSDLGAWDAVWSEIISQDGGDADGNVSGGGDIVIDSQNCMIRSHSGSRIAAIGLEDIAVISTTDAILVAPKDRVQDVKKVITVLKEKKANCL